MKLTENKEKYFQIAGLILCISYPEGFPMANYLFSFRPFYLGDNLNNWDIYVEVTLERPSRKEQDYKLLSDISQVWGDRFQLEESKENYITTIKTGKGDPWEMHSQKDFKKSIIYVGEIEDLQSNHLSWLLMVAFGQHGIFHKGILIHSSVIIKDGHGFGFLGKSGTGKSTHSRMWLEHLKDTELLNDDNPMIRIMPDETVMIFGTPWSGKTACYKNKQAPLKALIRLEQAPENNWTEMHGKQALLQILPSCTGLRWNANLYNKMLDNLEEILAATKIAYLKCLPNGEAARLNYERLID